MGVSCKIPWWCCFVSWGWWGVEFLLVNRYGRGGARANAKPSGNVQVLIDSRRFCQYGPRRSSRTRPVTSSSHAHALPARHKTSSWGVEDLG